MMLVMLFTMSVYSFARETTASKVENIEKYELKINHRRLASVLDLSKDQIESMDIFISQLEKGMLFAYTMETEESRNKILYNTVNYNVQYVRYILNDEQYKKYLLLLNLTLENRGFDTSKITSKN